MNILKYLTFISALGLLCGSALADVSYTPGYKTEKGGVVPKIRIHGEIREGDADQFRILKDAAILNAASTGIPRAENGPFMVELDSQGGSVSEAISLGSQIRAVRPWTVKVANNAMCVSSCVLVLAGGTSRLVDGRVGIHRPYIDNDTAFTPEAQKKHYLEIEQMVKAYLSFVNVPTSLYDVMFRIPPEKIRFLSARELQDFNLNEDDPYFKEARDAKAANNAGLTKSEFQRGSSECAATESHEAASKCYRKLFSRQ